MLRKNFTMWVTSFKTHCLVFFVCLFWKVGCVSTGVVTVFVFFPSVLPVIRTMLILFLQLTRGSLKRINQYPLLIPHTAASYLKPCPCYFFFFTLSSRNWPRTMTHPPVKCSLCCCFVVSLRQSSFFFYFLTLLPYPEPTAFLMKHGWKQNVASFLVPWPPGTFLLLLILPTKVLNPRAPILEWLLLHHLCWPYFSFLPRCWKRAFIVTDWSCRYTISNNTSSRWSSSLHCRIRRISACRSRLKIPLSNSYLTITQCSWRSCSWPHFDLATLFSNCISEWWTSCCRLMVETTLCCARLGSSPLQMRWKAMN